MRYAVHLVDEAEEDVLDIYRYVMRHDGLMRAQHVYQRLRETCATLDETPERGHYPPELDRIGVFTYREIHFKPYRIVYQIQGNEVFIHCVLDGRRSLQELLERRLLR